MKTDRPVACLGIYILACIYSQIFGRADLHAYLPYLTNVCLHQLQIPEPFIANAIQQQSKLHNFLIVTNKLAIALHLSIYSTHTIFLRIAVVTG